MATVVASCAKAYLDTLRHQIKEGKKKLELNTWNHFAMVYNGNGKLLCAARNRPMTRASGCGADFHTIHAEMAALKRLGDLRRLAGCTLVVARITPAGNLASSKPCKSCEKKLMLMMKRYCLKGRHVHLGSFG
jgi:hypothetical protein